MGHRFNPAFLSIGMAATITLSALPACFEQGTLPSSGPDHSSQVTGSGSDGEVTANDVSQASALLEPDLLPGYCPPNQMRDFQDRCVCVFPDPNLDQVIRGLINKPKGPLYLSELANIQEVTAHEKSIRDLDGLQCLVRLITLDLTRNQITDVTPVQDLVRLQVLIVLRNRVSDVSSLNRLTQLAMLDIGKNGLIEDASVVANMPNLVTLHMEQNRIGSLEPVRRLVHLGTLDAHNNQIRDISAVQDLVHLEYLTLNCLKADGITYPDVSAVSNKPRLLTLQLAGCGLNDQQLAGITNLPALEMLNLDENQLSDLSPVRPLRTLKQLYLAGNQVAQLGPLSSLPNLVSLFLSQNQIRDIAVLGSQFPSLSTLYLNNNAITDLSPLSANPLFGAGDVIDVYGNPFSCDGQRRRRDCRRRR